MHYLRYASGIALLASIAACYSDSSSSSAGTAYAGGGASYGSTTADAGTDPTLAFVDPGRTLNATPGQGVGVFVTYQSGGHWLVQWTCDTSITQLPCSFDIAVGADSGSAAQLVNDSIAAGGTVQEHGPVTEFQTTTTTEEDQASFTATAGATLTVNVELNGQLSGQYFFFVQNGLVNGGYQGALSDPMEFEPTSP
jgi:hypothetical protein